MLGYAIVEISGKQYKITPNNSLLVDYLGDKEKKIEVSVLLLSEAGKVKVGTPYLKDKITLKVLETVKGDKIRVSKFHAKANYRRTTGYRSKLTKVVLAA